MICDCSTFLTNEWAVLSAYLVCPVCLMVVTIKNNVLTSL